MDLQSLRTRRVSGKNVPCAETCEEAKDHHLSSVLGEAASSVED